MKMLKRMLRNVKMHARKKEGQVLLDDRNNYTPLQEPMVKETSQKVKKKNNLSEIQDRDFYPGSARSFLKIPEEV